MEIPEIKSRLDIIDTAALLGLSIDPITQRTNCPFHDDKDPSLQFSRVRQIATCFSSACSAGTMDIITLTERMMRSTTHEALKYLARLAGEMPQSPKGATAGTGKGPDHHRDFERMGSSLLASTTARKYLEERCIDHKRLDIGYNPYRNAGFNYLKGCVTFPLRDGSGRVHSLYGRSVRANARARHFYTADRRGLYPGYPDKGTERLILTESVIDAATLLSLPGTIEGYGVLALYGTNGLTPEHVHGMRQMADPRELILFLDGDAAGKAAVRKHGNFLTATFPGTAVSVVDTPENEDINSMAQGHEPEVFERLLRERIPFFPSDEKNPDERPSDEKPSDERKKAATARKKRGPPPKKQGPPKARNSIPPTPTG